MLPWKKIIQLRVKMIVLLASISMTTFTIYLIQNKPVEGALDFTFHKDADKSKLSNINIEIRYNKSGPDEVFLGFDVIRTKEDLDRTSIYHLTTDAVLIPQLDTLATSYKSDLAPLEYVNREFIYVKDDSCRINRHYKGKIFGNNGTHFSKAFHFKYTDGYDGLVDYLPTKITLSNIRHLAMDELYPAPDFCTINSVTFESEEKIRQILYDGIRISGSSSPGQYTNQYFYFFQGLILGVLLILLIEFFLHPMASKRISDRKTFIMNS